MCKGWEYPLPLYVLSFILENVHVGADNVLCCEVVAACKVERGVTRCREMYVNMLRARLLLCISG